MGLKAYFKTAKKIGITVLSIALCFTPLTTYSQPSGIPSIGAASAAELSPALERILGDAIMEQGRRDPDYISDPDVLQYLTSLGRKLVSSTPNATGQRINVFALRDSQINAFALPGGYIGINSGLFVASETESELASVVAHEVSHVLQRHIARGMTQSAQSSHIMIASIAGALLAALSGSGDLAMGVAAFGQAAAIDRQLGFSRQAEQEADRVGLQMMQKAGYNPQGMLRMFERLSRSGRLNEGIGGNVYVRTHPLSVQRMSDIEGRVRGLNINYQDNPEFWYLRAKLRVLQARTAQARAVAVEQMQRDTRQESNIQRASAHYGIAFSYLLQKNYAAARQELSNIINSINSASQVAELSVLISLGEGNTEEALTQAQSAWHKWSGKQSIALALVQAMQAAGQHENAIAFLRDRIKQWPDAPDLYQHLAFSLQTSGNQIDSRQAMASYYELTGALPTAVEHLQQARNMTSDFYLQSELDVRIRTIKEKLMSERALLERFKS